MRRAAEIIPGRVVAPVARQKIAMIVGNRGPQ